MKQKILFSFSSPFSSLVHHALHGGLALALMSLFSGSAGGEESAAIPSDLSAGDSTETSFSLSLADIERYQAIFAAQEIADWGQADELIAGLEDEALLGYVLHQRYLHAQSGRTSYEELRDWLTQYYDQPGAEDIYELARARGAQSALTRPDLADIPTRQVRMYNTGPVDCENPDLQGHAAQVSRQVVRHIRDGDPERALSYLGENASHRGLNQEAFLQIRADIAASYFYEGDTEQARLLAAEISQQAGSTVPRALWIGGLSAWRDHDYNQAASYFSDMALAGCANAWGQSAAAYWAARAYLRDRQPEKVEEWLQHASTHPRTFYGLLANRALGYDIATVLQTPALSETSLSHIAATAQGRRALALIQIGRADWAEQELLHLMGAVVSGSHAGHYSDDMMQALLAVADYARLPALSMRVGFYARQPSGENYDTALYPLAYWGLREQYASDAALMHAIIRQESRFDSEAVSYAGARGLMQIMPATARGLGGTSSASHLLDPDYNLGLGQAYFGELMSYPEIDRDLIRILAAYNAGPGSVNRWVAEIPQQDDPLLFMESIPVGQTRAYVERVLANYWIYRLRLGQDTPSLDALAEGRTPLYHGDSDFTQLYAGDVQTHTHFHTVYYPTE